MVVVLCWANEGGDEMSILIKLYNGEIYPADTAVPKTDNYKKAIHTQTEILETLIRQLSDEQDETIDSYIFGIYDCIIMGNETHRDGIIAATNKRLIFYAKKNLSYDMQVFPYSSILSIKISQDSMGHEISIFTTGNCVTLKWINLENFNEFIDLVSERSGKKAGSLVSLKRKDF